MKPPAIAAGAAGAGGIRALGAGVFADRPELRVDPTTILGASPAGAAGATVAYGSAANPATGVATYGFETAAGWRSLYAQGEFYDIEAKRQGLSTNRFTGGYLEASWTLTGESRKYLPASGAYSSISPAHPFSLKTGELGAFELAMRYSEVDLDSNLSSATSGWVGGRQTIYGLGLNWYPNNNIRFMLDYLHGVIKRQPSTAAGAPAAGAEQGGTMDALALRTQVAF